MKINKKQKELIKIFICLFVLLFIVINWDSVSWMFNYREVSGLVHDFFTPYPESALLVSADQSQDAAVNRLVDANTTSSGARAQLANYPYSAKENSIEIPTIGLVTPLVIGQSTDPNVLHGDLDLGVVYYPGSVLPGQNGQIVVLGHSAPPGWPNIKHDWVFTHVNDLNVGDQIFMYFNNHQYTYKVVDKNIIQRGQEVPTAGANNNILTLVSCWPPGKDYKRIAVSAELVKN